MSNIEISYEIAIPAQAAGGRGGKYPWDDMQPGGSFFAPGATSCRAPKRLRDSGAKFAFRKVTEGGQEGVRVWRTA